MMPDLSPARCDHLKTVSVRTRNTSALLVSFTPPIIGEHFLYIAVWTRKRPPVHVRCAICKKRLTSAHLGLGPPWEKKVGFDALARGFACCLHITSKGEPPAYCLSLCRRSSGHGMLHISHMQRQRVLAQRSYVPLMRGPSQGLVEHAVRVCVHRHVVRWYGIL